MALRISASQAQKVVFETSQGKIYLILRRNERTKDPTLNNFEYIIEAPKEIRITREDVEPNGNK